MTLAVRHGTGRDAETRGGGFCLDRRREGNTLGTAKRGAVHPVGNNAINASRFDSCPIPYLFGSIQCSVNEERSASVVTRSPRRVIGIVVNATATY